MNKLITLSIVLSCLGLVLSGISLGMIGTALYYEQITIPSHGVQK